MSVCLCVCRGWPQMLVSHWHSMLFGPGSYWTNPPWRQCWSFCASTQPVSPQVRTCVYVCMSVCVFRHCACPLGLSHTHSGLRAALSPLVTTEQHCVSLSPTSARLPASHNRHTLMATGSRPVGDDVWKIEPLCWLPHVFWVRIQRF